MLEAENCYVIHVSACEKPNELVFKDELRPFDRRLSILRKSRSYKKVILNIETKLHILAPKQMLLQLL